MAKTESHSSPGNLVRKAVYIIALLIGIAILFRLSLMTGPVHSLVQQQLEQNLDGLIQGKLTVGELDGDLWRELNIRGISLTNPDTVLQVQSVKVEYKLLSYFSGTLVVDSFMVDGVYASVKKGGDSAWNIALAETDTAEESALNLRVNKYSFKNIGADIYSELLPGGVISARDLQAGGSFSFIDKEIEASLESFSAEIEGAGMAEPVKISSGAVYDENILSLDQLLVETGRSFFKAGGNANTETGRLDAGAEAAPLSWQDMLALNKSYPIRQNLETQLFIEGNMNEFTAGINIKGSGVESFNLTSGMSYDSLLTIKNLWISGTGIDLETLLKDSTAIQAESFELQAEGNLPARDLGTNNPQLNWDGSVRGLTIEGFSTDSVRWGGSMNGAEGRSVVAMYRKGEELSAQIAMNDIFSKAPSWNIEGEFKEIDPAYWSRTPELIGSLKGIFSAAGDGFFPEEKRWEFALDIENSELAGRQIKTFATTGWIDDWLFNMESELKTQNSTIAFRAACHTDEDIPSYTFIAETRGFNIADVMDLEDVRSDINMILEGTGEGFNPGTMKLDFDARVDSSYLNREYIEKIVASVRVRDSVATVEQALINSEIAEGDIQLRQNFLNLSHPDNSASYRVVLKDLDALAPFFGVETLAASGNVEGEVNLTIEGYPVLQTTIRLQDIRFGNLFRSGPAKGSVDVFFKEAVSYNFNLEVENPAINDIQLQDVKLASFGVSNADSLSGQLDVEVSSERAGSISQSGRFSWFYPADSLKTKLQNFTFNTPERILTLEQPFHLSYSSNSISTDTLKMSSEDGAFLRLAVPYADSLNQQLYTKAQNFDFGVIQEILFGKRFVEGRFVGEAEIDREPGSTFASGAVELNEFGVQGTRLDRLTVLFQVDDDRFFGDLRARWDSTQKVDAWLDVPFSGQKPETLPPSFFEQPVSGALLIEPTQLSRFKPLLEMLDITNTDGLLSASGKLSGTAGKPVIRGDLNLKQAVISGIPADSVVSNVNYRHDESAVDVQAGFYALNQQAASFDARLPLYIDFKNFTVNLPDQSDPVKAEIVTKDFDLAVLNDFVDKQQLRGLRGKLNGNVTISGTAGEPVATGELILSGAGASIPATAIELNEGKGKIRFINGSIVVEELGVKSGGGSFNISGNVQLDGLSPETVNLKAKARQFKAANSRDLNMVLDMDAGLQGPVQKPVITGTAAIKNGFYFLDNFGEESIEQINLEEESASMGISYYDSLQIDMGLSIERNFFIRNRRFLDLEVELAGQVDIKKEVNEDPQIFGDINARSGFVRPLGKRFDLQEGSLVFSGPPENPRVFTRAMYEPPRTGDQIQVKIYYVIEGPADDPDFRFESEPEMELQDQIGYVLFGRPFYELDSVEQAVAGDNSLAGSVALELLLSRVETLATERLGIDVVQIDNTRTGSGTGTSIKTGWYVNRRTFFSIINEIGEGNPRVLFVLEYLLKENLDLIITQGADRGDGVDLRWKFDY